MEEYNTGRKLSSKEFARHIAALEGDMLDTKRGFENRYGKEGIKKFIKYQDNLISEFEKMLEKAWISDPEHISNA